MSGTKMIICLTMVAICVAMATAKPHGRIRRSTDQDSGDTDIHDIVEFACKVTNSSGTFTKTCGCGEEEPSRTCTWGPRSVTGLSLMFCDMSHLEHLEPLPEKVEDVVAYFKNASLDDEDNCIHTNVTSEGSASSEDSTSSESSDSGESSGSSDHTGRRKRSASSDDDIVEFACKVTNSSGTFTKTCGCGEEEPSRTCTWGPRSVTGLSLMFCDMSHLEHLEPLPEKVDEVLGYFEEADLDEEETCIHTLTELSSESSPSSD